jgi:hypothetical protein
MNQPRPSRRAGGVKGRALLLFRLARQDIRHHFAQAILLVVAIAVATATLTMAFALNGVNANPFQQTKAATNGPDVVAQSNVTSPADIAALVALNHAKGVEAHGGAVLGTVFVVAALTSVPARIGLRRPVAEMLHSEEA